MTKRIQKERIASIAAGSILFILAAVFTIAVFLRIFDYGTSSATEPGSLFKLGHMLFSAYGLSSLLIPLFFIVAGAFCFDSKWSVQRSLCLIVSPIPFMTVVIAEKLIKNSLTEAHSVAFVKIILLAVVSILLIAVEYLVTIILAGKLKKTFDSSKKSNVTSAPVFENLQEQNSQEEKKSKNIISRFTDFLSEKFKNLTQKDDEITQAPETKITDLNTTVEIIHNEDKNQKEEDEADDDFFQEPAISENFFEDKKNLLVDSGDGQISQKEDETQNTSANPFKKLFKKAQDKYKDIMSYGEMKDKEDASLSSKNSGDAAAEAEVVDINDFFKKPAERVVLKEDDYADLDLPPRPKVQDTVGTETIFETKTNLEYDYNNPTVIVDEKDSDSKSNSRLDENESEEIDINEFTDNQENENLSDENEETEFAQFSDDEEDIIGMFERQNQNLDDNNFLNQFEAENQEDENQSLEAFIDEENYEEEDYEPVEENAEKDSKDSIEPKLSTESFISQIRARVNARESMKTPAQIREEQEQEIASRLRAEREEAERQKKIKEEELYAKIREELKAETKKTDSFNFTPNVKAEVTTADNGLSDIFAKMDQDVKNKVESDPQFKARFTSQNSLYESEAGQNENKIPVEENSDGQESSEANLESINIEETPHKSFMAKAQALKLASENQQQEVSEPISKEPIVDYVFGNSANEISDEEISKNAFVGEDVVVEDVSDEIDAQEFLSDDNEDKYEDSSEIFLDEGSESSADFDGTDYENQEADISDDDEDFLSADENPPFENKIASEDVDYVFQEKKSAPPKPNGWKSVYNIPYNLLTAYEDNPYWIIDDETKSAAQNLKNTLAEFKIDAEVTGIQKGPVVTMFEILPAPGVKLNRIVALADNIALRLAASSVRIVAPIPGKHAVGIEVPNAKRAIISIRECLESDRPEWSKMGVPVVLGKDIQGNTQIIDLVKTPHLLIAGATGAGKSVCVNSMIVSMLYKRNPRDVKLILIDPKIVELKLYNDIPHLLTPVITEPKKAMQALQYCLCEMERRYALLDGMSVRDISSYNNKIVEKHIATEKLPYLIVIIDEFADLMATTGKQLEGVVARLAAMSRAVGIHLVLATQRPSIDVITGLIKANIPSRIAFMVASKIDSRIILDQPGAEKLLGKGDMLYTSATDPFPTRIQGTFVSDQEVENIVNAVKSWGEPEYIDDEIFIDDDDDENSEDDSIFSSDTDDPLYDKALDIVVQAGKASASYIQRRLKIGYNRAARLVEEMEERGIVGPANGSKPREIIHMP